MKNNEIDFSGIGNYGDSVTIIESEKAWYRVKIEYDDMGENPIKEWDMLGTYAFGLRRYDIGNEEISDFQEFFIEKLEDFYSQEFLWGLSMDDLWARFSKYYIYLPIYAYIHSGITVSSGGFSCPWDSGLAGLVYISKDEARKEYGKLTKKTIEKITGVFESGIQLLDDYLTGQVFWFSAYCIPKVSDNEEEPEQEEFDTSEFAESLDSCGGFYGDHDKSGILDYIKDSIFYHDKELKGIQKEFEFTA